MAEDRDQRTEEATAKRLEEAAQKGQVAYSQELSQAVLLLCGLGLLAGTGGGILLAMKETLREGLGRAPRGDLVVNGVENHVLQLISRLAPAAFPLVGGLIAAAAFVGYSQVGFQFRSEAMGFDLERVSPANGWRRLFSLRSTVQLCSSLVKLGVILAIVYASSQDVLAELALLGRAPVKAAAGSAVSLAFSLLLRVGVATLLVGGCDYLYQRWQHGRDLRMTKEEVKDENKQQQGDPAVKARIRRAQRLAAQRRMLADVPKASVVVTNPTHYAVALRYRRPGGLDPADEAPLVVAKGQDLLARRIREIATEAGVPIVENPPLARSLYSTTEVCMWIPAELYKAVAEVLAFVFKLKPVSSRK